MPRRQEIKRPWKVQVTDARLAVLGRARVDLCRDFGRRRFGISEVLGGGQEDALVPYVDRKSVV